MLVDQAKRDFERMQVSVAKLDAHRARSQAMMVTQACEIEDPKEVLLDIASQDVVEMLREYRAKQAKYVTAPFDHEGRKIRFFPGGYSVWSGFPGAGKTTILRQAICQWLNGGEGVFVASLEEDPRALLIRLAGTAFGAEEPTENQLRWFCDYYAGQLHIWGVIGAGNHRRILGAAQALTSKGVTQVVIDSLMCLDIDSQGWEIQRKFARLLATFTQTSNVHLHLVAHPKKPSDTENDVHITDVGGSKDIVGAADNVLFIRRGKEQDCGDNCGMKVSIRKQRHFTGAQDEIVGWFNRRLRQFHVEQFPAGPTRYLPDEAYQDRWSAA